MDDADVWWGVCECTAWPVVIPGALMRRMHCSRCGSTISVFPPDPGERVTAHRLEETS